MHGLFHTGFFALAFPIPIHSSHGFLAMRSDEEFQRCAKLLKALADSDRLRIVLCLFEGEKNVSEIGETLGEPIVKVSHHLGVLRHAGIVSTTRNGRHMNYSLHPEVISRLREDNQQLLIEFGCCRVDLSPRSSGAE